MWIIYLVAVKWYGLFIYLFSFFNHKAKQWVAGRKNIFRNLSEQLSNKREKRFWFHCASLGEYEQGKPVFDALKEKYPDYKTLLTFFSPSGYEVLKSKPEADYIFYLPLDGPLTARRFLNEVSPMMAVFVKNEFWHFYIRELRKRKIPLYIISARFRKGQIFFRWYGKFFEKMLRRASHIFAQDQRSLEIFYDSGLANITVSGDTRFDRVFQNFQRAKSFPEIEKFCEGKKILIAGSTWEEDEKVISGFFESASVDWKLIIAPHDISESRLFAIEQKFQTKVIRHSTLKNYNHQSVLLIDNIGMLASLYRYGHYAYIGGGFGKGLHNILEPAAFGLPVFFGPHYSNFPEARELVKMGTAFSVNSGVELNGKIAELENHEQLLQKIINGNKNYIQSNKGASAVIMNHIEMNFKQKA